jgi:hypothetical protein
MIRELLMVALLLPVAALAAEPEAAAPHVTASLAGGAVSVTVTGKITITGQLFNFTLTPNPATVACNAAPGSLVMTMVATGGDGNPVSFALAGDTGDFALSGNTIVVGPNGIAPANCPVAPALTTTQSVNVSGTQQ